MPNADEHSLNTEAAPPSRKAVRFQVFPEDHLHSISRNRPGLCQEKFYTIDLEKNLGHWSGVAAVTTASTTVGTSMTLMPCLPAVAKGCAGVACTAGAGFVTGIATGAIVAGVAPVAGIAVEHATKSCGASDETSRCAANTTCFVLGTATALSGPGAAGAWAAHVAPTCFTAGPLVTAANITASAAAGAATIFATVAAGDEIVHRWQTRHATTVTQGVEAAQAMARA